MRHLSESLERVIVNKSPDQKIRVEDFVAAAGDRAFGIVFLILALPSALPIPATGISTPLGLGMTFVAMQMIVGREQLWLPKRVLKIPLSRTTAKKMVQGLGWILKKFERFLYPRLKWIQTRIGHVIVGSFVIVLSLLMQLPIPLTNTLPAAVIFCMAVALTEDDGLWGLVFVSLAGAVILAYLAGFGAILFLGFQNLPEVLDYIRSFFLNA